MSKKFLFSVLTAIFVFICIFITYFLFILTEESKIIKFLTSYYLVENSNLISKDINPCKFSYTTLKNGVELSCKPLLEYCNNHIPQKENLINEDTACAIITFDINSFEKQPNTISSRSQIADQYQVLSYRDGIATIPNSIENNILYSKMSSFKRTVGGILIFWEIQKHSELFKKVHEQRKSNNNKISCSK